MPPKFNDLTNRKVGKLTVVALSNYRKDRCYYWECVCECGKLTTVKATSLIRGNTKSCGCLKKNAFVDYTGQTFGKLTLLEYIGKNKYNCHKYRVACSCGTIFQAEGNDVVSQKIKSCGCGKIEASKARANPLVAVQNNLYSDYKIKAKNRKLSFEIDKKDFIELTQKPCYLCGIVGSNTKFSNNKEFSWNYNGVDRVDNNKGYTLENCKPCCYTCNQAKHRLSVSEFENWINRLIEFRNTK